MPVDNRNVFRPPVDCDFCRDVRQVDIVQHISPQDFESTSVHLKIISHLLSIVTFSKFPGVFVYVVMRTAGGRWSWKMRRPTGRQRTFSATNSSASCTRKNSAAHLRLDLVINGVNSSRTRRNSARSTRLWRWATGANPSGPGISAGATATRRWPTSCDATIPALTFYPNAPSRRAPIGSSWVPADWAPTCTYVR